MMWLLSPEWSSESTGYDQVPEDTVACCCVLCSRARWNETASSIFDWILKNFCNHLARNTWLMRLEFCKERM